MYPSEVKIRSQYVAPKGCELISCDFSQAETWIVAFKSNDPLMKKSLQYGDIHTETAANIIVYPDSQCYHRNWVPGDFPWKKEKDGSFICNRCNQKVGSDSRYTGKRINHGSSYRMGPETQASTINKDADKPPYITISVNQSRFYNTGWRNYYKNVPTVWWPEIEEKLRINRTITTVYGHRMVFNGNWGDDLFRAATAFEPQSTVAQHANGAIHPELGIPGGFLEVFKQLYKKDRCIERIVNVSHDSIVVESRKELVSENAERIVKILRRPIVLNNEEFTIPVDCEVGERWGELEKLKVN